MKEIRLVAIIGLGVYAGLTAWSLTMSSGPFVRSAGAVGNECGDRSFNPCYVEITDPLNLGIKVHVANEPVRVTIK